MADTLKDKEKQLDALIKKIEYYKDVISGLESMNYDILGSMYDEAEFGKLTSSIKSIVKELENVKKSSDISAIGSTLTSTGASFEGIASKISEVFETARKNISNTLGLLNVPQDDGKMHSIGGDLYEQFEFIRNFDMSNLDKFEGQLAKYRKLIEDLAKANDLLTNQKSLNTYFQTQDNSDLNALLGKDIKSSDRVVEMQNLEQELQMMMEQKDFYTGGKAQGEKDFNDEIARIKSELESLRKAKKEVETVNGKIFDIEQIRGLIPLFNELNSVVSRLIQNRDMMDFIVNPINAGKSPEQLKSEAVEYGLIPDLSDAKAKDISASKELKSESSLLDEVREKREALNNTIVSAGISDKIDAIKVDTSNYTGVQDVEKIKATVEEYKALASIKKEIGKESVVPTDYSLDAYGSSIVSAINTTNMLREEVLGFKNALADGNTSNLLSRSMGLSSFEDKIKEVQRVITDGLQLHLKDDNAVHDLELLRNTVIALEKELVSLSFNNGISAELLKQKKEVESLSGAYERYTVFIRDKKSNDDSYVRHSQKIADLTMESEKLKKALEFRVFSNTDSSAVSKYLRSIESQLEKSKKKVAELEQMYSNMGYSLPNTAGIKASTKMDYLTKYLNEDKEYRLKSVKESAKRDIPRDERQRQAHQEKLEKDLAEVTNQEIAKRERILGGIKDFYSSILTSAKRELEIQEALGNIRGPEDRIRVYNDYLSRTVHGTEEWAKLTNLITQEQSKLNSFNKVKTYVADQNIIRQSQKQAPMTSQEEADYYASQLPNFAEDTREYIEVLKLKNQAEAKAADEAQKASDKEKQAYEESLNAAKQKITQGLSAIKSFADGVNNAVNKVVSIIRTGIGLVNKVISTAGKILNTLGGGVKTIITLFGNLGNRIRQAFGSGTSDANKFNGSINLLKGSVTELNSKITLLRNTFNTLFNNNMVNNAKKLLSSIYSINTIGGKGVTDDVIKWANSLEYAFGLSARDLIADIQELNGVMYGLGMSAENSVLASQNLLLMGQYLASVGFAGGDVDQVISKLTSGMKGMTAAIDDLGLSVRDAQMNSFLEDLKAQGGEFANLKTDFSSLNEQARVYVRYASLIKQFTDKFDITNFAKGLDTVTGRVSLFKSAVNKLMTVVGTGLLNVFAKLTTYLIPIINLITNLVSKLFAFFGISTELSSGMNGGDDLSGIGDGLDETGDKLDEVAEKADKAKGSLQGFDRVNNVTSSSGSDSGSGEDDFDYSGLMTSMIDELNKKAEEAAQSFADSLHDKMMENLRAYRDKFIEYAKDITGRADFDLGFDWPAIKENLKKIIDNIKKFIISWGEFFITIGLKIADDINIGAIITKFTELVAKVTEVANTISEVLQPALDTFYEVGIKPIMEYLGVETLNVMDLFIDKLDELAKWFVDNEDTVIKFFEDLGEKVAQAFRVLTGQQTLDDVVTMNTDTTGWGTFLNILDELPNKIKSVVDEVKKLVSILTGAPSLDAVVEMNSGSNWGNILTIISSLRDILGQLLSKLGEFATNEGLPWLQEKLDDLANWIKENKDKVVELIDKIAGIAWDGFKTFVDLVGKLIDFVVKNPDSVYGFFAGLLGLKVASWFTDVATSIGLAVVGMEGFTKLLSSGGILSKLLGIGGAAATTGGAAASISTIPMATTGAMTSLSAIPMATTGAQSLSTLGATAGTLGATAGSGATTAAAGFTSMLGPIAIAVAAIVGLIAVIKDLWDTSEGFRESVSNAWEMIKAGFESISEAITPAIENLKKAFSTFYDSYESSGLKEILDVILSFVVEVLGGVLSAALTVVGEAIGIVINVLGDLLVAIGGVIDAIMGVVDIIIGIITGDGEKIKQGFGKIITGILEVVGSLLGAIIDIAGGIVSAIGEIGENIFGGLFEGMSTSWKEGIASVKEWFSSWIEDIKEFFGIHSPSTLFAEFGNYIVQGLLNGIEGLWQTLVGTVTMLCTTFIESVKTILLSVISAGAEIVTGILNGITSVWQTLVSGVTNLATSFINSVKTILLSVISVGSTLVNGIWSGINSAWSGLASGVSRLCSSLVSSIKNALGNGWNSITSWLDSVGSKISDGWNDITGKTSASKAKTVTSHAVGGSIGGGQLFRANENGEAELIGNIDGSPKTNVANNNMIIEAMTSGVFTGVYNALAEVSNQRGNVGGGATNAKIEINGFGLIDSSTLSELARLLAPYNNSNNTNIADVNFSI